MNDVSPDTAIDDLNDLRRRVLANEEVSPDEYQKVVEGLRVSRKAGDAARTSKKAKMKADQVQMGEDLLSKLTTSSS